MEEQHKSNLPFSSAKGKKEYQEKKVVLSF